VKTTANDEVALGQDARAAGGQMNATATIVPAPPQHMQALQRANKVRLARAELKRRIAAGEIYASEVILECPWEADSMSVADLLMSQRRWGHTRCRNFLAGVPMSETKTVGSMTQRQRHALSDMLGRQPGRTRSQPRRDERMTTLVRA
jgi:hypothetical protein